ncbi:MAG: acyl-CoA dehydrogenase family protein [bacterium]
MKTDGASRGEVGQTAAKFAARHIKPVAADVDHFEPRFPAEIFGLGAASGFDRFALPEECGGHGFGEEELCELIETLARTCAGHAMVFGVHAAVAKAVIEAGGDSARDIPALILDSGRPIGVSVPEPLGMDDFDIGVSAVTYGQHTYLLSGKAGLAVNATRGGLLVGFARNAGGDPLAFVTALDGDTCAGCAAEPALGLRAMPMASISFDLHEVEKKFVIAERAAAVAFYFAMLRNLCLVSTAAAVGTMAAACEKATAYAAERYQGGRMIIDHTHMQTIIGGMAAGVESSIGAMLRAASKCEDEAVVFSAKKIVTDCAAKVCSDAVQTLGGYGYMRDYGLEKYMRDAAVLSLFPITNERCGLLLAEIGKLKHSR